MSWVPAPLLSLKGLRQRVWPGLFVWLGGGVEISINRKDLTDMVIRALIVAVVSLAAAGLCNGLRPEPLAWDWRPPAPLAPVMEDFQELQAALARPETVLVDARADLFYEMGHLPGAVNLPLDDTDSAALAAWRSELPPGADIIVYCSDAHCPMAAQLSEQMMALGLSPRIFKPGFDAWEERGLPVETLDSSEVSP